jgi:hypothetical protein
MNKTMGFILLCLGAFSYTPSTFAQISPGSFGYYDEALRFSRFNYGGTARMLGIGGAQTALGADISNAALNPAGLGLFRSTQLSFTGGMTFYNSESSFRGFSSDRPFSNFSMPQIGLVINNTKDDIQLGKWRGGNWAINFSRINDMRNEFGYRGLNLDNSILDYFIERADGIPLSQIGNAGLITRAYDTYLINPVPGFDDLYDSFILGFPEQIETVTVNGRIDQFSLAYGGNYDNRLFFGAGLGVNSVRYNNNKSYRENFDNEPLLFLNTFEEIDISGTGVNFNAGVMARLNDNVRIGASIISPTWYNLTEEFSNGIRAVYDNYYYAEGDTTLRDITSLSDLFLTDYSLATPWRVNGGISVIVGKNGFISADVEWVDYSRLNLRSDQIDMFADNQTINNLYKSTLNFRVGGEYRYDIFRFRGGYSYYQDPTTIEDDINRNITNISGGLGIRLQSYYVDLAVVHGSTENAHRPYTLANGGEPLSIQRDRNTRAFITVGFTF